MVLYIYAVPTSANTTRTVINAVALQDKDKPKTKGFGALLRMLPRSARCKLITKKEHKLSWPACFSSSLPSGVEMHAALQCAVPVSCMSALPKSVPQACWGHELTDYFVHSMCQQSWYRSACLHLQLRLSRHCISSPARHLRGLCRWVFHLTLNAVNDGDLVFMHRQSEWLRQAEAGHHPADGYYMPGQSDRWA